MKHKGFKTFQQIQARNGAYHVSPYSLQDQAIREHIKRGFQDPRAHVPGLLSQQNRLVAINELTAYEQELGI